MPEHIQPTPEKNIALLREKAIRASRVFFGDATLVHGTITTGLATDPPALNGYSINLPATPSGQIVDESKMTDIKAVIIGCMDQRQVADLYQKVKDERGLSQDQILMLTFGGGIVQTDSPETGARKTALHEMMDYVVAASEGDLTIIASAHTSDIDIQGKVSSPCGGIKYMSGDFPLANAVDPSLYGQLAEEYQLPDRSFASIELAATASATANHAAGLAAHLKKGFPTRQIEIEPLVVVPNEDKRKIRRAHREPSDPRKMGLSQLIQLT